MKKTKKVKKPVEKIYVPLDQRPRCEVDGCDSPAQLQSHSKATGHPIWRKSGGIHMCTKHHSQKVAANRGLSSMAEVIAVNAGFEKVRDYLDSQAQEKGFANHTEYSNSKHPYLRYRKDYCENVDGRFGFTCTTTITMSAMLQVDHIDGNPANNDPENLQTLCACCHIHKTIVNKDYASPGRKSLKIG